MSTLKTNFLQHPSSSAANLTLNDDGTSTIVPSIQQSNKNALVNGSMEVWQRGTASTSCTKDARTFLADRWYVTPAGAACTQSQSTFVAPGSKGRYCLAITGATSVAEVDFGQRIEASVVRGFKSKLTFSALIYNGTGAAFTPTLLVATPSASDDFTTVTNRLTQSLQSCADAAWTRVSYSFDASGYTNIANGLQVKLQFASGVLNSNTKTVHVTEVQLEQGSAVTPFEFEPYETTLRKCQRYYYKNKNAIYSLHGTGFAESTSIVAIGVTLPVAMRAAPTSIETSNLAVYDGATIHGSPSSINLISLNSSHQNVYVTFVKSSPFTQFRPYSLISNNTADGYLAFGSEL